MVRNFLILLFLIWISSCRSLKYTDDLAFTPSAKANYPDYYVLINGNACIDMNGKHGLCALHHNETKTLTFSILKQMYDYKLDFRCGNGEGIHYSKIVDVQKETDFTIEIEPSILKDKRYLNCIGDIFPKDRDSDVSSFFEARIRLHTKDYIPPSEIHTYTYKGKKYIMLGEHAYLSKVKIKNSWYFLKKQPIFRYKTNIDMAIVETKNMRRTYY